MNYIARHVRVYGKPVATIVATSRDHIGVTICNPCDKFDRLVGVSVALKRALESEAGVVNSPEFAGRKIRKYIPTKQRMGRRDYTVENARQIGIEYVAEVNEAIQTALDTVQHQAGNYFEV